jgi:hypothetical protein
MSSSVLLYTLGCVVSLGAVGYTFTQLINILLDNCHSDCEVCKKPNPFDGKTNDLRAVPASVHQHHFG